MPVNGNRTQADVAMSDLADSPLLDQAKAAAASLLRVFAAAVLAAAIATGQGLLPVTTQTVHNLLGAGIAAVALTALNWLRAGEPRFGKGARRAERTD